MPRTVWRSPAAYEDLRSFDALGFACEFLDRNPYLRTRPEEGREGREHRPLTATELDRFAQRCGCAVGFVRFARLGFSLMQGGQRRLLLYPYRGRT
jgi:hypothetical protein